MVGYDKILDALQRYCTQNPERAESLSLYMDLLTAQARVSIHSRTYAGIAQIAPRRIERGLIALPPDAFRADCDTLARLCDETCVIAARHRADLRQPLETLRAWLAQEHTAILKHAIAYLRGENVEPEMPAVNAELLGFVFNHALHPFLRTYAQVVAPFIDTSIWYRAYCPVCGGRADFAALAKETGARLLLCARCDFEWFYWRGVCPFCECDDPDQQKYFLSDDQVYRLYVCEKCHRYIKTIDLRRVGDERFLPVERILTLDLDLAALQMCGRSSP